MITEGHFYLSYYKRTSTLLTRIGARDRPSTGSSVGLIILEVGMLDIVMRAFVKGLSDPDVRRDALQGMVTLGRSLQGVYVVIPFPFSQA